jgi:hypothetical protein
MRRLARLCKFLVVLGVCGWALGTVLWAQGVSVPPRAGTYTVNRASVNSATVPVTVIAPGFMSAWNIHASTACTKPIDCFPFTSAAAPTAVPTASALREIDPAGDFSDNIEYFDPRGNYYRFGLGSGWACVFESGGATCNVDGTSR